MSCYHDPGGGKACQIDVTPAPFDLHPALNCPKTAHKACDYRPVVIYNFVNNQIHLAPHSTFIVSTGENATIKTAAAPTDGLSGESGSMSAKVLSIIGQAMAFAWAGYSSPLANTLITALDKVHLVVDVTKILFG